MPRSMTSQQAPAIHSWRPGGDPSKSSLTVLGFVSSPDFLIMQMNWEAVLELAMDAQKPEEYSSNDPGDPQNSAIRRHAIAVMDAVDRNGLVAPWTAVPHLLALTTDPNRCAFRGPCCKRSRGSQRAAQHLMPLLNLHIVRAAR